MSESGFNTESLVDPVDFYYAIVRNIDRFDDKDKFTILRFFDKLADSVGFSSSCKYKLKVHIDRKKIKDKAECIFNSECKLISILDDVAYLKRSNDTNWSFILNDIEVIKDLSNEEALKIVKDVNNAFLIKYNRERKS